MRTSDCRKAVMLSVGWLLLFAGGFWLLTGLVSTARGSSITPIAHPKSSMLKEPLLEPSAIAIGSGTINMGEQITVPISLSVPAPNLLVAITLRVEYDPTIVDFVSCSANTSDFTAALCNQNDGNGEPPDSVAFTALSVTGVNGELVLGEIAFLGAGVGTTDLHLIAEVVDDGSGESPILIDGYITVVGGGSVPSTVGIGSGEVEVGQLVTVPLTASVPIPNSLVALTIRVEYDPTVAGFLSCTPNNADFDANLCNHVGDGEPPDSIIFAAVSTTGVNGELLIGTITFLGLTPGETALTLVVEVFEDGSGLAPLTVDGALTIIAGPALPSMLIVGTGAVTVGELVTIPLTVSVPISNALTALTIRVEYDPTIVAAAGCRANTAPFSSTLCSLLDDDGIPPDAVAFSALSTTGVNGVIRLADITFVGVEQGTSSLELIVDVFEDGSGLPPLKANGQLEVIAGQSPVPSTLGVGSGTLSVGEQLTTPVTASVPLSNSLNALTIRVQYDPNVVGFVGCAPNTADFDLSICNNDDNDGVPPDSVAFSAVSVDGLNGALLIGSITFAGAAEGESALSLEVEVFEDGSGLPPGRIEGSLTVVGGVTARFTGSPRSGIPPLTVDFINLSTGSYDSCQWDFGDGGSSSECNNPQHEYDTAGIYDVGLTISGPGGTDTKVKANYITVYEPVTAAFSGSPRSGVEPLTVEFTNLSTGDHDSCTWDFGDGGTSSSCNDPRHEYMAAGFYDVSLTISGLGGSDSEVKMKYITVSAPDPEHHLFLPIILGSSDSVKAESTFDEPGFSPIAQKPWKGGSASAGRRRTLVPAQIL